ncbi:hypothetical protein D3C81_2136080 [compost metagenome]
MHGRIAYRRRFRIQFRAQYGIGLRQCIQSILQALEVQHGATDQQRQFAARIDFRRQA